MIEAMACGTPVIAFRAARCRRCWSTGHRLHRRQRGGGGRGSRLGQLDRHAIRRRFEQRFTGRANGAGLCGLVPAAGGFPTAPTPRCLRVLRMSGMEADDPTISPYYITAAMSPPERQLRTLKFGEAFATRSVRRYPGRAGHRGYLSSRYLCPLPLAAAGGGGAALLLGSAVRNDNAFLVCNLTQPRPARGPEDHLPREHLHLRRIGLAEEGYVERLEVRNFGRGAARDHASVCVRGRLRRPVRSPGRAAIAARPAARSRCCRPRGAAGLCWAGRSRTGGASRLRPELHQLDGHSAQLCCSSARDRMPSYMQVRVSAAPGRHHGSPQPCDRRTTLLDGTWHSCRG